MGREVGLECRRKNASSKKHEKLFIFGCSCESMKDDEEHEEWERRTGK